MAVLLAVAAVATSPPRDALAQGVVVDQGDFQVRIDGRPAGTENFSIRRAGGGPDDQVFANGIVILDVDGERQEIRPLLSATPPDGVAASYQLRVLGPEALELRMNQSGRRYVSRITSDRGSEDRELPARPDSRVLERRVAHHYYFLNQLRAGDRVHVLEPRSRRQLELTVSERVDEELRVGANVVQARRLELEGAEGERRTAWFDRQGRVLRVEVPSDGYVAERTDVVG